MSRSDGPTRSAPWPTYDKGNVLLGMEEVDAATRAVRSSRLFRYDSRPIGETEVGQFERELASFFGVKYALAVSTGTAALALALLGVGVERDDEVLCSAFGFPASPSSILLAGAKPVLFEIDANLHPDITDLESRITERTKAVLIVHMRGQAGDIQAIADLCGRRGLILVEDAVPALGACHCGKFLGTFGTVGAFSTQSDKSLNTGEGGFVLTEDTLVFERMVAISGAYEGRIRKHCPWELQTRYLSLPLFNFRMDEIRGAVARSQLSRLSNRLRTLKYNYDLVANILKKFPEISIRKPYSNDGTLGDSIVFRILTEESSKAFGLAQMLCDDGIEARYFGKAEAAPENVRSFWTWEFLYPNSSADEIRAYLPNSARWLDQTIDIPLSPLLEQADVRDLERAFSKVMPIWRSKNAW